MAMKKKHQDQQKKVESDRQTGWFTYIRKKTSQMYYGTQEESLGP